MNKALTFGPYSPIRQAGELYFVAGQLGVEPETKETGKTIAQQTSQALTNLSSVLAANGLTMNDVVKTTVFLTDMGNFDEMNEVYVGHFDTPRPSRSTIAIKELPRVGGDKPILVEIEAIAAKAKS